jgi:hypothetical protein
MAIYTKKRCNRCNQLKVLTDFPEKGIKKGVKQFGPTCNECIETAMNMPMDGATLDTSNIENVVDSISENVGFRTCRTCHETKPIDEFYKDRVSNGVQRYRNDCKVCCIEKSKDRTKKYNDAKANLVSDLTEAQWSESCHFFDYHCAYCGTGPIQEREHIVPVSDGGGYTAANIIPSCKRCNTSKGNRPLVKWYPEQPYFSKERLAKIIAWVNKNK